MDTGRHQTKHGKQLEKRIGKRCLTADKKGQIRQKNVYVLVKEVEIPMKKRYKANNKVSYHS